MFLQGTVLQIMHIPLNMGAVITKMSQQIEEAKAMPKKNDFLMLCYDPSSWKSEINMTVSKTIPDGKMVQMSGTFLTRVYDGPYQAVPLWLRDMDSRLAKKNLRAKKYYVHYAYCPKCSQKFGHNYCVVFAHVA